MWVMFVTLVSLVPLMALLLLCSSMDHSWPTCSLHGPRSKCPSSSSRHSLSVLMRCPVDVKVQVGVSSFFSVPLLTLQEPINAVDLPATRQRPSFVICQVCFLVTVVVVLVVVIVVTVVVVIVVTVMLVKVVVCSSVVVGDAFDPVGNPTGTDTLSLFGVDSFVAVLSVVAGVLGSVLVLPRAAEALLVCSAAVEVFEFPVIGTPPLAPVVVTMLPVLFMAPVAAVVVCSSLELEASDVAFLPKD
mmetsp:Transcript_2206/g.4169  ORF Transcript_2206/g.4169 Transcript_2206/m.4169 type:complete len:245 (+) Transcript_2206:1430-2164(+)